MIKYGNAILKVFFITIIFFGSNEIFAQAQLITTATNDTIICGGSVSLSAFGTTPGTAISTVNFDADTLPAGWTCSQTPLWNNPCSPGGVNGTTHFWMGNGTIAPRNLTTASYNLNGCVNPGVSVCFDLLFMPQGGSGSCEGPDLPNEGVNFQYSVNGGTTWNTLNYFDPNGGNDPNLINWNNWCYTLPLAALTSNTIFRWNQPSSSDANSDHWGIDNFIVYCNDPAYTITWQHDGYTTGGAGGTNPTPVSPNVTTTYTAVLSNGVNSVSSSITVAIRNPVITVNAGADQSICAGTCTQLTGTAKVINCPAQNRTFSQNQVASIFDNPNKSTINVSGLCNNILQPNSIASVCISQINYSGFAGFNNYGVDDLTLTLSCPSGQTITLVPANAINPGFFSATSGFLNTCFVTGAPSIVGQAPPTTGNWSPNQPFNNLAGCIANGVWTLSIVTPVVQSGFGSLYGWSITFNTPEVSYIPTSLWSPTTNMTNSNTLTPTVCPPPNAYTLTVSDTGGCVTASDIVNVSTISCPTGVTGIKIAGDTCDAAVPITFQVLGTSNSPYFNWNFGDPASGANNTVTITGASPSPNPTHIFSAAGTYTICATFQEPGFPVSQICRTLQVGLCCNGPGITLSETHVNTTCGNANGSINLTVTGGSAPYTYVWGNGASTQNLTGLGANTYTVTVTDANSCTKTLTVTISNSTGITLSQTHVNATCGNANGSIDLTVTGGIAPITYLWSNGAASQDITGLAANNYSVSVTNGNGCTATLSTIITNTAAPIISPIYHD